MKVSNFLLGIASPLTFHMVPSIFHRSYVAMDKPPFVFIEPKTTNGPIEWIRNSLVEEARRARCSHLLMCDTDQVYPQNALTKLLSHKVHVVGARIRRRYPPFDNLLFRGTIGKYIPVARDEALSGKLIEVDATGTGCVLYNMSVFKQIRTPWYETAVQDGKPVGEDFLFCSKLRAARIPIFVDTSVYVTHLTQMGITDSFADVYERVMAAASAASQTPTGAPQPMGG